MNCDQVFDILTRGPFPTGTACDPPVEAHLNVCPGCRRLAEALRPAVELFQEAVAPEESRDLPGYWCAVATDRQPPAVSHAPHVEPQPALRASAAPRDKVTGVLSAGRIAALLAIGVALGTLVGRRTALEDWIAAPPVAPAARLPLVESMPSLTVGQRSELAVLPAACYRHKPNSAPRHTIGGEQLLADARLENLICCTECHNSTSDVVPSAATVKVFQSCQVCHKPGGIERP